MTHKCDLGVECWAEPAHSQDCDRHDPRQCHPDDPRTLRDAEADNDAGYDAMKEEL